MIPVVIAVVSALGGALAVLGPTLLTSERRRLLGYLRDEAETLEKLKDHPESAALVRDSMTATAERYRYLASASKLHTSRRQFLSSSMLLFFVAIPLGLLGAFGSDEEPVAGAVVGGAGLLLGTFVAVLALRYLTNRIGAKTEEWYRVGTRRDPGPCG